MTEHHYLDYEEVTMWRQHKKDKQYITYSQALILLGDAVRQNYKYQTNAEWSYNHDSLHIQRVWKKEYYDYINSSVGWLIKILDPIEFISIYFKAIHNKDAVLLYDMTAVTKKQNISREVYAYSWNHVLEELDISEYKIVYMEQRANEKIFDVYITIYGGYGEVGVLSVDVCLKLILENERLQLLHESVLDANHVADR